MTGSGHDAGQSGGGRPGGAMPGPAPVVLVDGLRKTVVTGFRRRKVEILKGVDLAVVEGEVYGLLGPNGAGKTTTLKVLLGLMRPSAGEVSLNVAGAGEIGYLPENPYFYDYLTGHELLGFCARLFALPQEERRERVERALQQVGLSDAGDRQLRKYSKGMLQRIGIAQALINDPRLVFLDEPMTGLDPIGRLEVKRIIEQLGADGRTVVFSSHILADVSELCSRIGVMAGGVVVWQGEVADAVPTRGEGLEDFFMEVVLGNGSSGAGQAPEPVAVEVTA